MTRLLCLLPARNAANDLSGFLESAGEFCDAVIALDDGSTDHTAEILFSSPLVKQLLRNPTREDYCGWDDSKNRNLLLEAAAELEPDWIISVDADERIDADDAAALRDFLARDALPGWAYGLRVFRMVEAGRYDRADLWVYRLFAYERGQRL